MAVDDVVLNLVRGAYDSFYDRAALDPFLHRLRAAIAAHSTCFIAIDTTFPERSWVRDLVSPTDQTDAYGGYYAERDVYARAYRRSGLGAGAIWASHWLMQDAEIADSEFHADYLGRFGHFHFSGGTIAQGDGYMTAIGSHRTRYDEPFGEREVAVLRALMPHLQHASQAQRLLEEVRFDQAINAALLDTLPTGIVLLDAQGRVLQANAAARTLLGAHGEITLGHRGLAVRRGSHDPAVQRMIMAAAKGTASTLTLPRAENGSTRLRLVAVPAPSAAVSEVLRPPPPRPAVMLLVIDPDRAAKGSAELLRQLFSLTRRQAELATALAAGLTLPEAADQLGLTQGAARQLLKLVFDKTDTRRQSELVALLRSLPQTPRM